MRRFKDKASEGGQTLILAVGIVLVLAMGVVVVVLLNQTGARHQTASHKQSQGRGRAEEGLAYASQLLSADPATWNNALQGIFPVSGECTSSAAGINIPGTQFRLTCSRNAALFPGLQPYQVAVVVTAWLPDASGQLAPSASIQSFISQKTLGTSLSSGIRAAAALELVNVTTAPANTLSVHWGPIVCLDGNPWTLTDPLDQYAGTRGYPRKFSVGGILPRTAATAALSTALTDQKEFWAFAGMSIPVTVNEFFYQNAAINAKGPVPVVTCVGPCNITQTKSDYEMILGTAVFNGAYSLPAGTNIVYVNGSAEFRNLQLDLSTGAFVVNGNLTLGPSAINPPAIQNLGLNIPPTAPEEYAYWTGGTPWPCQASCTVKGLTCSAYSCLANEAQAPAALSGINFRGFLYVKGNLYVTQPGWTMAGTVLVGDRGTGTGTLMADPGAHLQIFYDAIVNHAIQVNPN